MLVVLSLTLAVCALAYAEGIDEVAPAPLVFFVIVPAIGLAPLFWLVRLIAVGRLPPTHTLDLTGFRRPMFMWAMTANFAILGAAFLILFLLVGGIAFGDVATPLKALISLALLLVFTNGLRHCVTELLIIRDGRASSGSSPNI